MVKLKEKIFYGWVVTAAFFLIGTTIWGVRFSFGVFFKSLEGDFLLSRAETSAILSAQMVLSGIATIVCGWALDKYGPRLVISLMGLLAGIGLLLTSQTSTLWQLFFTYSLLLSLGTGAIYVIIISTISRWFDKKRGLALGIAGSGAGLGTVIMAPLATFLVSTYNWRIAYLVMGIITLVIVLPFSRALKRDPYEIGALPDGGSRPAIDTANSKETQSPGGGLSLMEAARTRSFWVVLFLWLAQASTILLVFTHLVPHITDIGFSPAQAAGVMSLLGMTTVVGRIILGTAADRVGDKATAIFCSVLEGISMLWLIWARELWMLWAFALVLGVSYGGLAPSGAMVASNAFGLKRIGAIMGVLDIGFAAGAAIGPAMGGLIFDITRNYSLAFLLAGIAMLVSAVLVLLMRREVERRIPLYRTAKQLEG